MASLKKTKKRKTKKNPQLLVISNPSKTYPKREVKKAEKAYKRFHFKNPPMEHERNVPAGWPQVYVVIGECERFDVETPGGKVVSKRFKGSMPILATTSKLKSLYIFWDRKLGIPKGTANRIDYRVPKSSGRNKWSNRWWHPHDSHPSVKVHSSGKAVNVCGPGLSITPAGIEG